MVQRDVVDLCVVLQQLPDAVHVIPLSCHVDGGQTILEETENGTQTEAGKVNRIQFLVFGEAEHESVQGM